METIPNDTVLLPMVAQSSLIVPCLICGEDIEVHPACLPKSVVVCDSCRQAILWARKTKPPGEVVTTLSGDLFYKEE
jgi:hypothetical protein